MEFIEARYAQANVTSLAFDDIFEGFWQFLGIWTHVIVGLVAFEFVKTILTRPLFSASFKWVKTAVETIRKAVDEIVTADPSRS